MWLTDSVRSFLESTSVPSRSNMRTGRTARSYLKSEISKFRIGRSNLKFRISDLRLSGQLLLFLESDSVFLHEFLHHRMVVAIKLFYSADEHEFALVEERDMVGHFFGTISNVVGH